MRAQAQSLLIACTKHEGKDKKDGRVFEWFKYDFMDPQTGVSSFTGGTDVTKLVDKPVLITFDIQSKTEAKIVNIEAVVDGEAEIN